jgi:DNA-binding winged helix-turn-helix (wHTH) protein
MSRVLESRVLRFGPFELDRETGELRKHGIRVRLQGKPLQVLLALLEHPGQVVARDELKRRLWSEDTFVDFESGLNTAANRLRLTLGDSADQPRYVETLARSGYRFIAPVGSLDVEAPPIAPPELQAPRADFKIWIAAGLAVAIGIVIMAIVFWPKSATIPTFQQIAFRRGTVWSARFAPGGETILYSARWEGEPWGLFLASRVSPETRSLGYENDVLNAVSRSGELALITCEGVGFDLGDNLSRVPLNGGSPKSVTQNVVSADWSADGRELAVIRVTGAEARIEFPIGNVVYKSPGMMSDLRVSRDGTRVAFVEHPVRGDDAGAVRLSDAHGNTTTLSEGWASAMGLAWSPTGNEVWFTAARSGAAKSLWAAAPRGNKVRQVARIPGAMILHDVTEDGAVLVSNENARLEMAGRIGEDQSERDLSWFDWSAVAGFSRDGTRLLFDESGEGGGPGWAVYLRDFRDGSTVRVGEGRAQALDPDARWAVTLPTAPHSPLTVVDVQGGAARQLPGYGLDYHWAHVFPDGKNLLVAASQPGHGIRMYVYPLDGSRPRAIEPELFLRSGVISSDGQMIAGADLKGNLLVVPVATGGPVRKIPSPAPVLPVRWSADGKSLLVQELSPVPIRIYRIRLDSGEAKLWREITPAYSVGVQSVLRFQIAPDEKSYAYSYRRTLSQLYVANGWR